MEARRGVEVVQFELVGFLLVQVGVGVGVGGRFLGKRGGTVESRSREIRPMTLPRSCSTIFFRENMSCVASCAKSIAGSSVRALRRYVPVVVGEESEGVGSSGVGGSLSEEIPE